MKTIMHYFSSLKKNIQKIKINRTVSLDSEMNLAPVLHRQKSKHLSKDPLLNRWCQHLISHTLAAFQNPLWRNYSKQRVSSIFISQGSLIFLPVLIFQKHQTKYYINLCLAL